MVFFLSLRRRTPCAQKRDAADAMPRAVSRIDVSAPARKRMIITNRDEFFCNCTGSFFFRFQLGIAISTSAKPIRSRLLLHSYMLRLRTHYVFSPSSRPTG
jgi:hypothetical protein